LGSPLFSSSGCFIIPHLPAIVNKEALPGGKAEPVKQDNNYIGGIVMPKRRYTHVKELLPAIKKMAEQWKIQ